MSEITIPTEKQGAIGVFEEDGNINIVFFHERLELTVEEALALVLSMRIKIEAVLTRESPDNA